MSHTVEILSIGTELLMGQIANTDAQFISRRLGELGISIYRQCTVGDNPARVLESIRESLSRSDIVITTGGLGHQLYRLCRFERRQRLLLLCGSHSC